MLKFIFVAFIWVGLSLTYVEYFRTGKLFFSGLPVEGMSALLVVIILSITSIFLTWKNLKKKA